MPTVGGAKYLRLCMCALRVDKLKSKTNALKACRSLNQSLVKLTEVILCVQLYLRGESRVALPAILGILAFGCNRHHDSEVGGEALGHSHCPAISTLMGGFCAQIMLPCSQGGKATNGCSWGIGPPLQSMEWQRWFINSVSLLGHHMREQSNCRSPVGKGSCFTSYV